MHEMQVFWSQQNLTEAHTVQGASYLQASFPLCPPFCYFITSRWGLRLNARFHRVADLEKTAIVEG